LQKNYFLLTTTAKKLFSLLLKASILVLAFIFIYREYLKKGDNLRRFQTLIHNLDRNKVIFILSLILVLMLVNWILESLKWRYITRNLVKISVWGAIEAVFCGLTWAIFTPNRLGEYAGRILFLPPLKRAYGVFAMAIGSFGQNVITNVLGLGAVLWFLYTFHVSAYLHKPHIDLWLYLLIVLGSVIFMAFITIFYFHIIWLVNLLNRIPGIKKYHKFFDIMSRYKKAELIQIMGFCLARFSVFSFQYYLVIHLLIPQIPVFQMMMMVFILFFVQSALPSLDLFDFGVRSVTATTLFVYITNQPLAVIAAVTAIWLINLIIPAILGSVFVFKLNFFDRSNL
jgi:uncharacterized membrane protein YbhN (UPF0104 family)